MVMAEMDEMLRSGDLRELEAGGFMARNGVLMITGAEVETREGVHVIVYLPGMHSLHRWLRFISPRVRNTNLSTQKADAAMIDIIAASLELQGIFCLAHAFTPHKGTYGAWTDSLTREIGPAVRDIKVIELGLSADTGLAATLSETQMFSFLSNSDAHSSPNIGREYNSLDMKDKNFAELQLALSGVQGRKITANYGLHPRLGKYRRSYCPACDRIAGEEPPVVSCPLCGNERMVMGVYDRLVMIQDSNGTDPRTDRPPYFYRVPLKDLPGIGPVAYNRLIGDFANEIQIMETVPIEHIRRTAGDRPAAAIEAMRSGTLVIRDGGGGYYGKVSVPSAMM